MGAEDLQWGLSRFADVSSTFFVSVARHPAPAAGGEGPVDLAVTDCSGAWTAQGVTSELGLSGVQTRDHPRLTHLVAALSDLESTGLNYTPKAKLNADGSLVLIVEWQPDAVKLQVRAALAPAAPPQPVIADLCGLMMDNMAAAVATASQMTRVSKEFEKQAARSQDIIDKYVSTREAQEYETNAKVAALLNSKKKKLRELEAQLREAQEEIQRLKGGGGAAMDVDQGEESAGGQAGGSKGGGGKGGGGSRARAHHRQVVDDSDEEEEEGGGDSSGRAESPDRGDY